MADSTPTAVTGGDGPQSPSSSVPAGVVRLLRPKQWVKNVLVFAAPGAAGVLDQVDDLLATLVAFVAFCLAASGTYALNDARDVHADRAHPRKRFRPVAAGVVGVGTARALGAGLVLAGIAVAALAGGWELPATAAGYVVLTTSYTLWLKHIAVVDIAAVAAGFVVRAIAGAAATGVPLSEWFLIVASFGSLFMVAGKRSAEMGHGAGAADHRAALRQYTPEFLAHVRSVAAGVALLSYCLWAFEKADAAAGAFPWFQLSIVPFVLAVLRYGLRIDVGEGETPEDVVLGDTPLLVLGALWGLTFLAGVELG